MEEAAELFMEELPEFRENIVESEEVEEQCAAEVSSGGGDVGCRELRKTEELLPEASGTLKREVEEPMPPPTMFILDGFLDLMLRFGSTNVGCKSLKRYATYFEYSSLRW